MILPIQVFLTPDFIAKHYLSDVFGSKFRPVFNEKQSYTIKKNR